MRYLIIPDSFKGTMTSEEVGMIMERAILRHDPQAMSERIIVADGGEGTLSVFHHRFGGEMIEVIVKGPHFQPLKASYLLLSEQKTAIIEMAQASGYEHAFPNLDPSITTTFGVGELMMHAAKQNINHLMIGCGGSATNDGGAGMLAACGVKFFDQMHQSFIPTGGTLNRIHHIDITSLDPKLKTIPITILTDVDSPLTGQEGASIVFSPQKGATQAMAKQLDQAMQDYASMMEKTTGKDVAHQQGVGAAGGLAYGLFIMFHATIQSGIHAIWEMLHLSDKIDNIDVILTGEGTLDDQTKKGKVLMGILEHVDKRKPIISLSGQIRGDLKMFYEQGLSEAVAVYSSHEAFMKRRGFEQRDFEEICEKWVKTYLRGR